MPKHRPYISHDTILPEVTTKAILLGIILSAVLASANAYLGLFAGMTVSASIPAAVISMAILRLFKNSNILENNAVQTAASAGESLAAGVIFTFPALVLMGYWDHFNYLETTMIALAGGVLGVLFTIPLRSALIIKQNLQFPEGVATAEVLKSGTEGGSAIVYLIFSGLAGAFIKFSEAALGLWNGALESATMVKGKTLAYFGMNMSPALIAVGYIVGIRIAILVFIGGVITWWVAIPVYISNLGLQNVLTDLMAAGKIDSMNAGAAEVANAVWSYRLRFLGVGAMVVGGLWALISIRSALSHAIGSGLKAFKDSAAGVKQLRTELDTPMSRVLMGIGILIIPIFIIYLREIANVPISAVMSIIMVLAGFLFSAVAGYMAGLVGSSNNPISGVTIATILTSSLILLALMGSGSGQGAPAAILIGAVVCCAAAIAGDNMQDLKAGHVLGATPRKQQFMQIIGVISAALIMAPVLNTLLTGYGIGPTTIEHPDSLTAPQASLMESVAVGVFEGNLPWNLIIVGGLIAVAIIIADEFQRMRQASFRLPVLAVAVGLYLPFELDSSIFVGGLIAWAISKFRKPGGASAESHQKAKGISDRTGLLFASGLITGEALIGIGLAVPIAITKRKDLYPLIENGLGDWAGIVAVAGVCIALFALAVKAYYKRLTD